MFTVDHSERKEKRGKKQMTVFLEDSLFAGVTLSLLAYLLGVVLKKKFKCAIFNPLLISIVITIVVLVTAHVDYDV